MATPNPLQARASMEQQQNSASSSQFLPFAELPPELRLLIWSYASSEPQGIKIVKPRNTSLPYPWPAEYTTPPLLHVCQESRYFILERYKLSFSDQLRHPVYFDETKDILAFDALETYIDFAKYPVTAWRWPRERIIPNIRFLAVPIPWWLIRRNLHEDTSLTALTKLETLFLEYGYKAEGKFERLILQYEQLWEENFESKWMEAPERPDSMAIGEKEQGERLLPKIVWMSTEEMQEKFGFQLGCQEWSQPCESDSDESDTEDVDWISNL